MRYFQPFGYFVNRPGGFTNLLYGCLCVLIPVIGPIVLLGYRAEVAEDLDRDPDLGDYPDFTFERFGEYLSRGVWPFVMQLLVTLAMTAVMMLVVGLGVLVAVTTREPTLGVIVGAVLLVPLTFFTVLVMWPLELHTQLTERFAFGAACGFASRMLGRVWWSAVGAVLAFGAIGFVVSLLGYAACIIGIYPAMVIVSMAEQHFIAQLYRLYLDEGGTPIRLTRDELDYDED